MSKTTDDPADPRVQRGPPDETSVPQNEVYLVLSEEERAKGFERPYRDCYVHKTCNTRTHIGRAIAETYARRSGFYEVTYCVHCRKHRPVSEFLWEGTDEEVGS